ncbi:GGDEF domain-containing protein [Marinobacterium stanieri]|uniref:diguanylate cyclase n=1 Tax=Marinobacterium stanieri TaxID=49186 RepID=A0A1N6URA5_9GAMM|nr:GGDEF domain-containing protein [Marinobacterium stanieri]SIQ68160.1 diguanylate cyclase (GGDEF) domain-containing protein [Marinobacterium stanieri]
MIHRKRGFGLTAKTLGITLMILALIIGATLTMSRSFEQLQDQTQTLATSEMENLMISVRLVQQSESLGSLGARLASADTHSVRRRALIELTDRLNWVSRLTQQLANLSLNTELINQMKTTQDHLNSNIDELNALVSEHIDGSTTVGLLRQISALSHNNQELAGQLSILAGYFSATMRQQIANQSERLAGDIQSQQQNLLAVCVLVLIFTLLAGLYFELRVVRRILSLQRLVSSPVVNVDKFDARGGDEIASLASTVRSYVQRIQSHEAQMQQAHQEMTYLAEHDALTGLANRRHFQAAARRLLRQCTQSLCVAIGDIDHFKQVNDRYGHAEGDQVLVNLSKHLSEGLRESDVLARFGGEEFAIILPISSLEDGQAVLDKLRLQISSQHLTPDTHTDLTMSFGIALIDNSQMTCDASDQQIETLLDAALVAADQALYTAKRKGRNQVVAAAETVYAKAI